MQTIASLAKRLDMSAERAVEVLRHMLFDVDGVESEISGEACDLLIEVEEDPGLADRIRNGKLKDIQKAQEAEKKAEKRKAAAKKKADQEAEKKVETAAVAEILPEPEEEPAEPAEAEHPEIVSAEIVEEVTEAVVEPAPVVESAPVVEVAKPVEAPRVMAEIMAEEKPKAPQTVIGKAIEHAEHTVEVVRADGTRLDIPEAAVVDVAHPVVASAVPEEEEHGLLAEAQRRQEEEDRRRAKVATRPLAQPDPAVVAEVIRKAAERGQRVKEQKAAKVVKVQKAQTRTDRPEQLLVVETREETPERRSSNTGKTARKRQKKAEKARTEQTLRREAAQTLRNTRRLDLLARRRNISASVRMRIRVLAWTRQRSAA